MALGERQRLRLFVWRDPFDRFVSCLVYVPREAYSTDLRIKFQRILLEAFSGTVLDFDVLLSDAAAGAHPLHRAHHAGPGARVRPRARSSASWPPPRGAGTTSCAMR